MDKRDPVCGTSGSIRAHGHYFCSQACIVNYEKQGCVKHCIGCNIWEHKPWYKRGLYIFGLITIFLMIISYSVPQLNGVYNALVEYIGLIWWAILLGLLIGGAIDYFVPKEYISTFLSTHRKSSIFYAVGLGFIMSACCHGILAISIELYKKGASIPSIVAFLLASPWANLPVTILLFGFFGVKALYIVVSAVVIAIITGFIFQVLDKKGKIEKNPHVVRLPKKFSIREDFKKRLRNHKFSFDDVKGILKGAWALAGVVVWWILLGMILAAFVRAFVPSEFFVKYLGATLLGLIITLIFAGYAFIL